ncbi:MAG: hypothetical protein H6925_00505 [Holosporaceae bacterium]|nr:MAG: hypothetical protein H6925_00505 [Holosporaceae bacterium]
MNDTPKHQSAQYSHYDGAAALYDSYNESRSLKTNKVLERVLNAAQVKTVLDLSCGTGSQVFYLADKGYQVVGIDIIIKCWKRPPESPGES